MITVHGASASPFVRKVLVALEEKGIPYQNEPVFPFGPNPDFRKISPLGKIPAITENGRALSDSSIICAYLERTHPEPPLYPRDPYEYARSLWFEEYADSALVNVLGGKVFFQKVIGPRFLNQPTDEAVVAQALAEEVPPLFDYLESQLDGARALAGGSFSIADASVTSQVVNFRYAGHDVDAGRWPKLRALVDATVARPSFAKQIERDRALFS